MFVGNRSFYCEAQETTLEVNLDRSGFSVFLAFEDFSVYSFRLVGS